MKRSIRIVAIILLLVSVLTAFAGCDGAIEEIINELLGNDTPTEDETPVTELVIEGEGRITMEVGELVQLKTNLTATQAASVEWSASNDTVTVSGGTVRAVSAGVCMVYARYGKLSDNVLVSVIEGGENNGSDSNPGDDDDNGDIGVGEGGGASGGGNVNMGGTEEKPNSDPYAGVVKSEFYASYEPATGYWDAYYRSLHGLMSGNIGNQDQEPTISAYQPMYDGMFVRNSVGIYGCEGNSYTIVDAYGTPVMTIYRGGAYIMLEEVAAYLFAFGEIPANHTAKKKTSQAKDMFSTWGEYLRLNFTQFSGSTSKYPYEPELPNISGCGGDLKYYEVDIGTTGTDCDPKYDAVVYNNGSRIERGAARIVFSVYDKNGNAIIDINEKYLFYTYNHYNDFQEYLNYWGGWGEMFGNVTGGGQISSKYNYNPTPYVRTVKMDITKLSAIVIFDGYFLVVDNKTWA